MKDTWFGVGFLIFFLILDGFVGFWVCGFFHKNVNTLISSTAVLKVLDGNSLALCSFRHKLCLAKPHICRESCRIVSLAKLLFVVFYVCRMKRLFLTALASLLQG